MADRAITNITGIRQNLSGGGVASDSATAPSKKDPNLTRPRKGLNCHLSYQMAGGKQQYSIRIDTLSTGIEMLGSESQARMMRAFYPHRVTAQRFAVNALLNGYNEHVSLTNWLSQYVTYALDPNRSGAFREMEVSIPAAEMILYGVPLTGYVWGDRVGRVLWNTGIEFETTREPWSGIVRDGSQVVNYDNVYEKEESALYWYPEGVQLAGEDKPITYDKTEDERYAGGGFFERFFGDRETEGSGFWDLFS